MELNGQAGGPARYPRLGLSPEEDQKLKELLASLETIKN